jgi:hypothetical protein
MFGAWFMRLFEMLCFDKMVDAGYQPPGMKKVIEKID